MNILVTGGAGFIGSHLVHALIKNGHDVLVVDDLSSGSQENLPEAAHFIKGDIRQLTQLDLPNSVDIVFHLAAQIDVRAAVADPLFDASVNIDGTIAVLEYARKAGAKQFIFSSSGGAVYGTPDHFPTTEQANLQPNSPYGLSKWAGEEYALLYQRLYNLPVTILRYSNVYGPGQEKNKESGVIAIFCQRAQEGKGLTIFGDGKQTRDFVHVNDVVQANLLAMQQETTGVFNISSGIEITINDLAKLVQSTCGKELSIDYEEGRAGEEYRSCLSSDLAKSQLGWEPKTPIEDGLKGILSSG